MSNGIFSAHFNKSRYENMLLCPTLDNILYNVQRQGKISFYVRSNSLFVALRLLTAYLDDSCKLVQLTYFVVVLTTLSMARKQPLLDQLLRWLPTMSESFDYLSSHSLILIAGC